MVLFAAGEVGREGEGRREREIEGALMVGKVGRADAGSWILGERWYMRMGGGGVCIVGC